MKKKLVFTLALGLALAALLAGCDLYQMGKTADSLMGLFGGGETASSSSAESAASAPVDSSVPASSSQSLPSAPQSAPQEAEEAQPAQPGGLALNPELTAWIGKTNGELKQAMGQQAEAASYIMYGGAPVAGYYGETPAAFWLNYTHPLDSPDPDPMFQVWEEMSDGAGNAPPINIWPDDFTVYGISVGGDGAGGLFTTGQAPGYEEMADAFGQSPQLYHIPAGEGAEHSYEFDTWTASYTIDGYTMDVTFAETAGEKLLYHAMLYKQ